MIRNADDSENPVIRSTPFAEPGPLSDADAYALLQTAGCANVLVVGSLNVDVILEVDGTIEDDSTLLVRDETTTVGGHAGNCAAALAALGASVHVAAALGTDADGDLLIDDLRERGIDTTWVRRYPGARTGRAIIPLFGDRHFMLMSRGANDLLTSADVEPALRGAIDAIIVFDPSPFALLKIVERVNRRDAPPPLYWTPGGVYAADPLITTVLPHCETLLANRHECVLIGERVPDLLAPKTKPEIVVTLGSDGALLSSGASLVKVAAQRATVTDPTGAGDAFTAAYVLASLAQLTPQHRLQVANAAGAIAVEAIGARGSLATLSDLIGKTRAALQVRS